MKTVEEQRKTLQEFVKFATDSRPGKTNYGALLMISPPGDVSFLAPVAPELRGVEIVSPVNDTFDIWRNGSPIETNLTATKTLEWLQSQSTRTEKDFKKNIAKWAEDTFKFYRIPMRH